MKKQWIGFMIAGMLVAAVPTNVNAEDLKDGYENPKA